MSNKCQLWKLDQDETVNRFVTCEPLLGSERQLGEAYGIGLRPVVATSETIRVEQRERER